MLDFRSIFYFFIWGGNDEVRHLSYAIIIPLFRLIS